MFGDEECKAAAVTAEYLLSTHEVNDPGYYQGTMNLTHLKSAERRE